MNTIDKLAEANNQHYEKLSGLHGQSVKSAGYNEDGTHLERINRAIKLIKGEPGNTVFDLGIGLGHLGGVLEEQQLGLQYGGCDIYLPFVEHCRERFPTGKFIHGEFNAIDIPMSDYFTAIGPFNMPFGADEQAWRTYIRACMTTMFACCRRGIIINLLSDVSDPDRRGPELFYENAGDLVSYCLSNLSRFVTLDHSSYLFEFTIAVYKPQFLKEIYGAAHPKYFKS